MVGFPTSGHLVTINANKNIVLYTLCLSTHKVHTYVGKNLFLKFYLPNVKMVCRFSNIWSQLILIKYCTVHIMLVYSQGTYIDNKYFFNYSHNYVTQLLTPKNNSYVTIYVHNCLSDIANYTIQAYVFK